MQTAAADSGDSQVKVVGSFGSAAALRDTSAREVLDACDIAEVRLDLLLSAGVSPDRSRWRHLDGVPLLFTARRGGEGGAGDLDAHRREKLLLDALDDAAWIDIEVASIPDMRGLLRELENRRLPWIASFHDFRKLPSTADLRHAAQAARDAGAAIFKAAAMTPAPEDLARLANFQLADHGLPVATMGMGPLAPSSRLLCAQCGSALNYGYLGAAPTAPGQWPAALLKLAISSCRQPPA